MKELIVTCMCTAAYKGKILVPDDYSLEEASEYAQEHADEILHCHFAG